MMFEQDSQLRELAKILDRYRRDLEAALTLGNHKAFRCQPVQDLAQRTDADAVILLHRIELEASGRSKDAEDDVGANASVSAVAGRHRRLGMFRNRQRLGLAFGLVRARHRRLVLADITAKRSPGSKSP